MGGCPLAQHHHTKGDEQDKAYGQQAHGAGCFKEVFFAEGCFVAFDGAI